MTARQWRMIEKDMGNDAFRAGYSTRDMAGEKPEESTRKHTIPEVGARMRAHQYVGTPLV